MSSEKSHVEGGQSPGGELPKLPPQTTTSPPSSSPIQHGCPTPRKDGGVCKGTPGASGYCPHHDPQYSIETKRGWSRRGAMSNKRKQAIEAIEVIKATMPEALLPPPETIHADTPSYATLVSTRVYLEKMSAKVAHNEIAPSQATAIVAFAALALRLNEVQLEADMLAVELAAAADRDRPVGPRLIVPPAVPRG